MGLNFSFEDVALIVSGGFEFAQRVHGTEVTRRSASWFAKSELREVRAPGAIKSRFGRGEVREVFLKGFPNTRLGCKGEINFVSSRIKLTNLFKPIKERAKFSVRWKRRTRTLNWKR